MDVPFSASNTWELIKNRRYYVRHLERARLGAAYSDIVQRVRDVAELLWIQPGARCAVAADATGVGTPVVELIRGTRFKCELTPVIITGGEHEGQSDDGMALVPKRDLVVGLQVLLQAGELKVASGLAEGERLVKEMSEMRVKISLAQHEQYAVWREGEHDDLVLAVALACWRAKRREIGEKGFRLL